MVSLKRKVMAECSFFASISMIFCSSGLALQMICAVWQMAGTPASIRKCLELGMWTVWTLYCKFRTIRVSLGLCSTNLRTCKFICSSDQLSPVSTFKSLQIGGFLLCLRRNRRAADLKRSPVAFKRHRRDRGYCISGFNALVAKYSLRASHAPRANSKCRQVFLKVPYAQNMTSGWLQSKIRKLLPLLRQSIPEVGIGLCWAVGRNLFAVVTVTLGK